MELAMSGHLWDVLKHPCAFWGMDRGSDPGLGAMDSDPSNLIDGGQQRFSEVRGGPPRPEDSAGVGITDEHVESHCSSSAQDRDYSAKEKGGGITGAQ